MKRTTVIVFIAFCAASALSLAENEKKSKPSATVAPASEFSMETTSTTTMTNTTTAGPNTTTIMPNSTTAGPNATTIMPNTTTAGPNTTTIMPNTTTAGPNTTTAGPNTTTIMPNTTTAGPNTTTAGPNTTTIMPNTTTAKTTVPPPKPTPPANLTEGNYNVTTDKNVICLIAQMALQIRLATPQANGTFIVQPKLTYAVGGCQENQANLTLVFTEGYITFMFNKSVADKTVYVDALSFSLSYPFSKEGNNQYKANNKSVHLFTAKIGHSYSCTGESLYMGNGLYLDVNKDRMQAFNLTKTNDFGTPDRCAADQPDYRVAIAVGVTLLVLIVVVLIAYLLGRRKRTDGYQSL